MNKQANIIRSVLFVAVCCWAGLFLPSCGTTDDYYGVLKKQPELIKDYNAVYGIGDTMAIRGHFIREGLKITVGGANTEIIGFESKLTDPMLEKYRDSTQTVRMKITSAMGIGPGRAVNITSSGITISGPAIEIVQNSQSGLLPKGLTVEKIADYPAGALPVYCRSGKGDMYFIDPSSFAVTKMKPDGSTQTVLDASRFRDSEGASFLATRLNGAGVDPKEHYLYLSLYTEAPWATYWNYYRLCRYDLQSGKFEVLNKTPYYIYRSKRTLADAQPFEGKIGAVKMYVATGIYPDSLGNVYFNMNNRFVTRLDASGDYSYLFKVNYSGEADSNDPAPQIVDPATDAYISAFGYFPGVVVSVYEMLAFDPDGGNLYLTPSTNNSLEMARYDLATETEINFFNALFPSGGKPYLSGSFKVLTGPTNNGDSRWGLMPSGKGKLLILWYQDLAPAGGSDEKKGLPGWSVLDFEQKNGTRYAPGAFDRKGYAMSNDRTKGRDVLLNYDADGMLYLTAGNRSVILKTIYK